MDMGCLIRFSSGGFAHREHFLFLFQQWVEGLTADRTNYLFRLQQTIFTEYEAEINQHFVVVKLAYEYFDGR